MKGENKYEKIRGSIQENFSRRGNLTELIRESAKTAVTKPCVFLSHISSDKKAVLEIGEYFSEAGVDYYLDIDDPVLQQAVSDKNHELITECIEVGINKSTHLLSIISEKTQDSWWVPYEIGYAKKGNREIAVLELKHAYAPSYLKIVPNLSGIDDLNDYIRKVIETQTKQVNFSGNSRYMTVLEGVLRANALKGSYDQTNPLTPYLRA